MIAHTWRSHDPLGSLLAAGALGLGRPLSLWLRDRALPCACDDRGMCRRLAHYLPPGWSGLMPRDIARTSPRHVRGNDQPPSRAERRWAMAYSSRSSASSTLSPLSLSVTAPISGDSAVTSSPSGRSML